MKNQALPPEELTRHTGFLRALARGILADEHAAEDVVQHVFVQALLRPPRRPGALRAWLARATRRASLNELRGGTRRDRRERAVARAEAVDGEAGLELAVQRRVLEAVAALDEPYRSVVHMRYFRGTGVKEIARELGVPVKTVQSRLTRAHGKLRERLDRAFREERGAWTALLTPAALSQGLSSEVVVGGVALFHRWLVVALALLMFGGLWTWKGGAPRRAGAEVPPEAAELAVAAPAATGLEADESGLVAPEPVAFSGEAARPSPVPRERPARDLELERALRDLLEAVERHFPDSLDAGAVLDAARLVAAHDTGPAIPEPVPGGGLRYPVEGLPEGVSAELSIATNTRGDTVLSLEIHLTPPRSPWWVDGCDYAEPAARAAVWISPEGALRHLTLATSLRPGPRFPFDSVDEVPYRVTLSTPWDDPRGWTLSRGGLRPQDGDPRGEREWRTAEWEGPQVLSGSAWPRVEQGEELARRLREMHEELRARSR